MRRLFTLIFMAVGLSLGSLFAQNRVETLSRFEAGLEGDTLLLPFEVPGTIQQALSSRHIIPDPFIGDNEKEVQWVSDRNWLISTTFEIDQRNLEASKAYLLRLSRVDTFGEIYLNGALVGTTDNYFRDYSFDIKDFLHSGTNRLIIRLLSPTQKAHPLYLSSGINYPADNDRAEIHYSPLVRTSPYHFGWDWGPRLISMGIDAPIVLEQVTGALISGVSVRTKLSEDYSKARVSFSWQSALDKDVTDVRLKLFSPEGGLLTQKTVPIKQASGSLFIELKNPRLWWPLEMGSQPLYSARLQLMSGKKEVARKDLSLGIREIVLDRGKDKEGEKFAFHINGKPFYAKGANYLPHDRRFRKDGDTYTLTKLFTEDLVPVHINMLRVWGGGEYESEEFYNLADSLGILIWQDFPFACSTYPNDPAFRENVARELQDNLTRISLHPSIALFCGNNEVREGIEHWGWKKKYGYTYEVWQKMHSDYDDFFKTFLPKLVSEYAPDVPYIHGSPVSSNWGIPESLFSGDSHYWGVWFGGEDFTTFDLHYGRFASEFGFQAFPEIKTVHAFAPNVPLDSLSITHPLLQSRQRSFIGNKTITDYMERDYAVPGKFSDYIYTGQILQAHGMDYAIRAIRRGYPTNRGLLFWQLNDVWQAISWSSVDYYGNWKALHYKLRSALAPVIADIIRKEDRYELWLCSDQALHGALTVTETAMDFTGKTLWTREKSYTPPKGEAFSKSVEVLPSDLFAENGGQMVVLIQVKGADGALLADRLYYPLKPKDLDLPLLKPLVEVNAADGKMIVILSAESLIKDLYIRTPDGWQGARLSDNFFDLLPGQTKTVTITHPAITPSAGIGDITLQSLNAL